MYHDSQRKSRFGASGGDGFAHGDGARDGARRHRSKRSTARVRKDKQPRRARLSRRDGVCGQLRVGESIEHDIFVQTSVREDVRQAARRARHARRVRRVAQHRQIRGAHSGWRDEDAARAPQREHARVPTPSPAHPRRLPVHRSAGFNRRHDGDVLVHPHRHRKGHARHVRIDVPRRRSRAKPQQVQTRLTVRRRARQAQDQGHRDSRRFAETRHGGGARIVQGRHRSRQHVSRRRHLQEMRQAAPHRRRQGLDNHHH